MCVCVCVCVCVSVWAMLLASIANQRGAQFSVKMATERLSDAKTATLIQLIQDHPCIWHSWVSDFIFAFNSTSDHLRCHSLTPLDLKHASFLSSPRTTTKKLHLSTSSSVCQGSQRITSRKLYSVISGNIACATGQNTVHKKASIHYIISINDMVHRPLQKCF